MCRRGLFLSSAKQRRGPRDDHARGSPGPRAVSRRPDADRRQARGPAGAPGPKGGANLEDLLDALRFGLPQRPALAHRLDKDTSGCLVLGRHRQALQRLGRLFAAGLVEKTYWAVVEGAPPEERRVDKTYWAVVEGAPSEERGRIELPLARRSADPRSWWMKVDPEGLPALTEFSVLGRTADLAWLELRPQTGRTHQLRVHLAALRCPILGDTVYGARSQPVPLHLHARGIAVPLYPKRPAIAATAPPPEHMLATLQACGWAAAAHF